MIITKDLLNKDAETLANTILENKDAIVLNTKTLKSFINGVIDNNIKSEGMRKNLKSYFNFSFYYDEFKDDKDRITYKKPFRIVFTTSKVIRGLHLNMNTYLKLHENLFSFFDLDNFTDDEINAIYKIIEVFEVIGRLIDFIYFIGQQG